MLTMSQINHIKDLNNCGYRITRISKKRGQPPRQSVNNFSCPPTLLGKAGLRGLVIFHRLLLYRPSTARQPVEAGRPS